MFVDELDAVGGSRKAWAEGHTRKTLNQLLVEMDGFEVGQLLADGRNILTTAMVPHGGKAQQRALFWLCCRPGGSCIQICGSTKHSTPLLSGLYMYGFQSCLKLPWQGCVECFLQFVRLHAHTQRPPHAAQRGRDRDGGDQRPRDAGRGADAPRAFRPQRRGQPGMRTAKSDCGIKLAHSLMVFGKTSVISQECDGINVIKCLCCPVAQSCSWFYHC